MTNNTALEQDASRPPTRVTDDDRRQTTYTDRRQRAKQYWPGAAEPRGP